MSELTENFCKSLFEPNEQLLGSKIANAWENNSFAASIVHWELRKITWRSEKARWGSNYRTVPIMCSLEGGYTCEGSEKRHFIYFIFL